MRLHDLKPAAGSHKERKRLGRGNASGTGTTAGKGTKGQKARSGGVKAGFRGMSSRNQRLAKRRGFNNIFKVEYEVVNLSKLARFDSGATVDMTGLEGAGLISGKTANIKILGDGELDRAIHLDGLKASTSARQKIEAAGGSVKVDEASVQVKPAKPSAAKSARAEAAPEEPAPPELTGVTEDEAPASKARRSTAKKQPTQESAASGGDELDNKDTATAETETATSQETNGDTGSA